MEGLSHSFRKFINTALFWALVLTGLGLLFLVVALPVVKKRRTMELTAEQMDARNLAGCDKFDRLRKEEQALRTGDPFYLEKLARERLNMGLPGERELEITPTPEEERLRKARQDVSAPESSGLRQFCGTLDALSKDQLMRQVALILGALSIVAAVALFGRSQ